MSGPFEDVLAILDLEQTDVDTFTGASLPQLNRRVYGGQVLAQSLLAAGRTTSPSRALHSMHGYFLRPGSLDEPIIFTVERLRDGGSFSARRTHAIQSGKPILSLICSFQEDQGGLEHANPPPPDVPSPEELGGAIDLFSSIDHPSARFLARTSAFDIRHVGRQLYITPDPERSTEQALWMRPTGGLSTLPDGVSPELMNAALLAYGCDQVLLEPVLRGHGAGWISDGLNVASLDHAMWWHRRFDVTDWLLYVQDSPSARGGRGLGLARVYSRDGRLVATIAQEGMVRLPPAIGG